MVIVFEDKELEKLIFEGQSRKYRAYARDRKFLDRLRLIFREIDGGIKIIMIELNQNHYGNL